MAATVSGDGRLSRTGPDAIHPPIAGPGDETFELRPATLAVALLREESRVCGAVVRDVVAGAESRITASVVVVCGDTLRTPQLLWASGIRPPALGRYLNEHAFLSGRVVVDLARIGNPELPVPPPAEWATAATWLPASGVRQPFQGQIMQSPTLDPDTGASGYAVILALYVPTELSAQNRLEFSETELDRTGLPRTTIHFSYSEPDLALIDVARRVQAQACGRLGDFDPERDSRLLPAGSSLHCTGTVRMGAQDDGTSVCDRDGRVWGLDNLYVAGNGVVPTPLVANATLTGAITAVRAGRAVAARVQSAR